MTAPDVAALLREVVTINTRQSGEVDWQAIAQQLDDEGWRISAPEPFDDLFAAWNALKRSAERKRVSAQAAPEGWTDGRSVLAAYENDVRDIEQAAVRAALVGLLADVTIERSKTSIRDGSTSGRFVVDWLAVIALIKARLEALNE